MARCWFQIFVWFNPIWDQCDSTPSTPMIGRDENGFRTSRLKEYPDGLVASFAQTLVDQLVRKWQLSWLNGWKMQVLWQHKFEKGLCGSGTIKAHIALLPLRCAFNWFLHAKEWRVRIWCGIIENWKRNPFGEYFLVNRVGKLFFPMGGSTRN